MNDNSPAQGEAVKVEVSGSDKITLARLASLSRLPEKAYFLLALKEGKVSRRRIYLSEDRASARHAYWLSLGYEVKRYRFTLSEPYEMRYQAKKRRSNG